MKSRKAVSKGKSRKIFRKATGVHSINLRRSPMRGGIRL